MLYHIPLLLCGEGWKNILRHTKKNVRMSNTVGGISFSFRSTQSQGVILNGYADMLIILVAQRDDDILQNRTYGIVCFVSGVWGSIKVVCF